MRAIIKVMVMVFCSLLLALTIRASIVEVYLVSGNSMLPSLHDGDRGVVWKLGEINRGDIVILDSPDRRVMFIKRVVGLPNETVLQVGNRVFVDGRVLEENYITPQTLEGEKFYMITAGPNEYIVLGDNRPNSHDSRFFGPVQKENIHGEMVYIW